ncbi:hypothetical protein F1559_001369 [Cyanidiococcus yangmingshanensis]|uniref:Exportin-T n=1 Tax=Cyanidiococcus yangmingshanensis TaxID=2690220 RepID=A0A7J7II25_9RHOD|nr:hypothetical protein F1559_001369 [Cyanidiococcus yangmingshanensis]
MEVLELCWSRAVSEGAPARPELVFWCLQVLFSLRHRLSLAQVRALYRSPQTTGAALGFVKNKVAQLLAELVAERYPASWPNAVIELLQMPDTDGALRFLRALHDQVLARETQRNTEASRVKEAMRADGAALMLLDWWAHLLRTALASDSGAGDVARAVTTSINLVSGPENPPTMLSDAETAIMVLELLADYVYWLDLSAVLERFQEPLFHILSAPFAEQSCAGVVSAAVTAIERILERKVPTPTEKMQLCEALHLVDLVLKATKDGSVSSAAWSSMLGTFLQQLIELHETKAATVQNWAANVLRTVLEHLLLRDERCALLFHAQTLPALASAVRTFQGAEWDALFSRLLSVTLRRFVSWQLDERHARGTSALQNGASVPVRTSTEPNARVWCSLTPSEDQASESDSETPTMNEECFTETISLLGQLMKRFPTLVLEMMQQLPARYVQARLLLELASYVPVSAQDSLWENARQILADPFIDRLYFDVLTRFGIALLPTTPTLYAYVLPMVVSALESDSLALRAHVASSCVRLIQALHGELARDANADKTLSSHETRSTGSSGSGPATTTTTTAAASWNASSTDESATGTTEAMLIQSGRFRIEYLLHHFQGLVRLDPQDVDLNLVQMPLVECISLLISSAALSSDDRVEYLENCLSPMHAAGLFGSASGLCAVLHLSKGFTPSQCSQDPRLAQMWLTCLEWVLEAASSSAYGLDESVRPLLHRLVELLPEPRISNRLIEYFELRLRLGTEALFGERDLQALVQLANQLCARYRDAGLALQQRLFTPMVRALLAWFPLLSADRSEAPSQVVHTSRNNNTIPWTDAVHMVLSDEARERYTLRNLFYAYLSHLLSHGLASVLIDPQQHAIWPCVLQVVAAGAVGAHVQSIELVNGVWRPAESTVKLPEFEAGTLMRAASSVLSRLAEHWAGQGSVQELDVTLLQTLPGLFRCSPSAVARENIDLQIMIMARLPEADGVIQLVLHEANSRGCTSAACVQYLRVLSQLAQLRCERERRGGSAEGLDSKQAAAVLPLLRQIVQALTESDTATC